MARKLRSGKSKPEVIKPVERDIDGLSYAAKQVRGHCVVCGMMADVERYEDGIHEVDAWMQFYGGQIKQHYELAPEYRDAILRLQLAQVEAARLYLLDALGLADEDEDEAAEDFDLENIDETDEDDQTETRPAKRMSRPNRRSRPAIQQPAITAPELPTYSPPPIVAPEPRPRQTLPPRQQPRLPALREHPQRAIQPPDEPKLPAAPDRLRLPDPGTGEQS